MEEQVIDQEILVDILRGIDNIVNGEFEEV